MNKKADYHIPVLLHECIGGLNINPEGIYVDVTYGGGGHARAIIERLTTGKLIAFDQDNSVSDNLISDNRFTFVQANYSFLKNFLRLHGITQVNGLLADLGISSHQIDTPERGFSTRFDGPLDLRMNVNNSFTAKDLVNNYTFDALEKIFREYGELSHAGKLAHAIVNYRSQQELSTTLHLKAALRNLYLPHKENKFMAQVFQALRIEVNDEMGALKEMLKQTTDLLVKGGRLVVLTYHSLEDRLVKNFMKSGNIEGVIHEDFYGNKLTPFELITRKPVVANEQELVLNNRSRSAKLRIAEKK